MLNRYSLIRASGWAGLVLLLGIYAQMGLGALQKVSLLLVIGGFAIAGLNWYEHRGGRSPSFLFLVFGCIFLCGRAFPSLVGDESQLAKIGFGNEYYVADETVFEYAWLVLASFFFVHFGSLIPQATRNIPKTSTRAARIYFIFFVLFLPLYLYKNISYLNYVMSSGGYLAIYQDPEFVEGVGLPIRAGALLCMAAFTLYFFHETNRRRARWSLLLFIVIFSSELLIGLRGKFFVVVLAFLFFYKIRFGGKFSLRGMLGLFVAIFILAIAIEIIRQGGSSIEGSFLMGFFVQQGVTAGVNLVVLDDLQYFADNAGEYLVRQFMVPFYAQPEVEQGWFLANDVSMLVMPAAYTLGFGTGSSYLAELVLLGSWAGVFIGSLSIGWMLSTLRRFHYGVMGALSFWVVCGLIYYPRTMLHDPIHNLMRYALPILFVAGCGWLVQRMMHQRAR